jgi:prolyl oligopeptidase
MRTDDRPVRTRLRAARLAPWMCIGLGVLAAAPAARGQTAARPPVAPIRPVVDTLYGVVVTDPYRYMENLKDPAARAWMRAQNDYTRAELARIPGRDKLLERIRELDQSVPHVQVTRLPDDRYLVLKILPGDNTAKLYLRHGLHGDDRMLVDPSTITLTPEDRAKGKSTIGYYAMSPDNKYVAVGITPGGNQNDTELHVIDAASGRETGDVILRATMGSIEPRAIPLWLPDSRSFVYEKLPALPPGAPVTELYDKGRAYLHVLGRDPAKDPAVLGYGVVPTMHIGARYDASVVVPGGSAYAVGEINKGGTSANSAVYIEPVADLETARPAWRQVAAPSDDVVRTNTAPSIAIHGDDIYLLTSRRAPRYEVVRTDARHPELISAVTVVRPGSAVITGIHAARDALYVQLLDGGISRVLRVAYGSTSSVEEVALPFAGTVTMETDPRIAGALFGMESWTRAYRIYAYDPGTHRVADTGLQPMGPYDNPGDVASVEVKVRSYDGTLVPLSIVYPKGMKLDGSNPTLVEGYGAYGTTIAPQFEPPYLAWYEAGGVYAACHVRGGGAYGEQWHRAGEGPTKPNTWRDLIACAQYLIEHKYTSPKHLAGLGISAGGIAIGRAITTRPDLFAAAVDWVGAADMLRFETTATGRANIPEFGSTSTRAGFEALYAMSPYAHVKARTPYPAVLLLTGINDPYVVPWQLGKMTARLQAATSSGKPVLLRVDYAGGHQILGATRTQTERVMADIFSFVLWQCGAAGFQPTQ